MSKNNDSQKYDNRPADSDAPDANPEIDDILDTQSAEDDQEVSIEAENVRLQEELEAARDEIEKEKKEYLFLMAEFDNFRKRTMREKSDIMRNAGESILNGILPIVDDMERALAAAKQSPEEDPFTQGVNMIYQKLVKFLESKGVKAMESTGADFNADLHEAIASIPAPSDEQKGKVLDTTQKGYMLNDKVLRHAKVAVGE